MSSDEIDAFRAELLRQKIIFEAELRRQRDAFEEQLASVSKQLADREADCRNLQAVVTILGKKIDVINGELQQQRTRRPSSLVRSATPTRGLVGESPSSARRERAGSALARRPSPLLSASNGLTAGAVSLRRVPSLNALSRANSPSRAMHPASSISSLNGSAVGPGKSNTAVTPSARRRSASGGGGGTRRRPSTHRLQDVKADGDW